MSKGTVEVLVLIETPMVNEVQTLFMHVTSAADALPESASVVCNKVNVVLLPV